MEKIKVMHIIRRAEGGMKKHLLSILNNLDKNKYEVAVGCNFDVNTVNNLKENGIKVFDIDICDGLNPSKDLKSIIKLREIIKEFKPEIIHFHGSKASLVGRIACIGLNLKIVITIHNFPDYYNMNLLKKNIYLFLNRYLNKRTSKIITVSNALKNEIEGGEAVNPNKIKTIYNCVDISSYKGNPSLDLRKEYNIDSNTLIIGCISRLIPSKGVQDLINALALIKNEINLFVFIAGDGPYLEYLKSMIKDMKLDNIEFLGYRDDIPDFLRNIDIFVLPSYSEGFGLSVAEAMFLEKPVIATDVGGIPEIIKNNVNGLIVKPGKPQELAVAIKKLASDERMRKEFSLKGKEYVINNFSREKMLNEIDFIYDSLRRKIKT